MNTTAEEVTTDAPASVEPDVASSPETPQSQEAASPATDTGAPQKTGAEKRIGQLTAKFRQSERERLDLLARFEALENRVPPPEPPARPHADDFETASEYEDALFEWRDESKTFKAESEKPAPQKESTPEGWEEFEDRIDELKATIPDIGDKVFTDAYACTDDMMTILLDSERGPEVAYHLATNEAEANRIAKLSPVQQARELFTIEQSLPVQSGSAAPEPAGYIKPGGAGEIDAEKMSADEWRIRREAEIAKRDGY